MTTAARRRSAVCASAGCSTPRPSASGSTSACARAAATAERSPRAFRSQPVQTEFGRKTRIHQSSCNLDMSCVKGDCPSFLLVERVAPPARSRRFPASRRRTCPNRSCVFRADALIRMPGVGGTGVVTAAAILRTAAHPAGPLRRRAGPDRARPEGRPGHLGPALGLGARSTGQIRASRARRRRSARASTCSGPLRRRRSRYWIPSGRWRSSTPTSRRPLRWCSMPTRSRPSPSAWSRACGA